MLGFYLVVQGEGWVFLMVPKSYLWWAKAAPQIGLNPAGLRRASHPGGGATMRRVGEPRACPSPGLMNLAQL